MFSLVKEITSESSKILEKGFNQMSRLEVSKLLGVYSLSQMSHRKISNIEVPLWLMSKLSKESFSEYKTEFLASVIWKEGYSSKVRPSELYKIINRLVNDKDKNNLALHAFSAKRIDLLGYKGVKRQNAIEYLTRLNHQVLIEAGLLPSIAYYKKAISPRLSKLRFDLLACILLRFTEERYQRFLSGDKALSANEIAVLMILEHSSDEVILRLENTILSQLSYIESFRYENYVRIESLESLLGGDRLSWLKFFNAKKRNKITPPSLHDMDVLIHKLESVKGKSSLQIKESVFALTGKKIIFIKFKCIQRAVETGQLSFYAAASKYAPEIDKSLIYRTYKTWLKDSFCPWWEKDI